MVARYSRKSDDPCTSFSFPTAPNFPLGYAVEDFQALCEFGAPKEPSGASMVVLSQAWIHPREPPATRTGMRSNLLASFSMDTSAPRTAAGMAKSTEVDWFTPEFLPEAEIMPADLAAIRHALSSTNRLLVE